MAVDAIVFIYLQKMSAFAILNINHPQKNLCLKNVCSAPDENNFYFYLKKNTKSALTLLPSSPDCFRTATLC